MAPTKKGIEKGIRDKSIAAISSWLKAEGLPHSANTRVQVVDRLAKLIGQDKLSEARFQEGLNSIEEASAKRIMLYEVGLEELPRLRDTTAFARHLEGLNVSVSDSRRLAPTNPIRPTLVYVVHEPTQIRVKWAEGQIKTEVDLVTEQLIRTKTVKVVLLLVDTDTGFVELRFDKPELIHIHRDSKQIPRSARYFSYYQERATEIVGTQLKPLELRGALRSLVETVPRIVRVETKDFRTGANSRVRFVADTDVRDDEDWKAMYDEGGEQWAYDAEAVYWLPEASDNLLNREVFTEIDARIGRLRVEADCHEGEIAYAVSRIREHKAKVSQP
jgi:hypothetical protein